MQKKCQSISLGIYCASDYDTNQSVAAVVDDFLYRFPYFAAGVGRHTAQLVVQSLVYKLVNGFSEDIALPDFFGAFLEFL